MMERNFKWSFPPEIGKFTLIGRSRAADATSIAIPELKLNLDAGELAYLQGTNSVFITHSHMDHIGRITHFVSRKHPPRFYVPESVVELVEAYLLAAQEMSNNAKFSTPGEYQTNHHTIGLKGGDTFEINDGRIRVETFNLDHSELKTKLRSDLVGLTGKQIAEKRRAGENVNEQTSKKLFAFLGDTTHTIFENTPNKILQYPVVIVECSFIDDEHIDHSIEKKHMHWNFLRPFVEQNPTVTFILIHFSLRYKADFVKAFFAKTGLKNVVVFLADDCHCGVEAEKAEENTNFDDDDNEHSQ